MFLAQTVKDAAVEEILQEAAEAFAIERAKQEIKHDFPDAEEIAAAVRLIHLLIALLTLPSLNIVLFLS